MLCGVGGAAVFGVVLDLTRKYTFPLFLGNFCSIGSLLFFYTQVKADNFPALAGACACMGFFFISGLPVSMETGVELTFPVGEAVSSSFLILSGNVFVVIFTVLFNVLQQGPSMDFPLFVSLCCCAGAFSLLIIYILLKPIYRRLTFPFRYFVTLSLFIFFFIIFQGLNMSRFLLFQQQTLSWTPP